MQKYIYIIIVIGCLTASYFVYKGNTVKISDISSSYSLIYTTTLDNVRNLSGITYSQENNSLYCISNSAPIIYKVNNKGIVTQTIPLDGFNDTEGIVSLGNNLFGVIEERRSVLDIITLTDKTKCINICDVVKSVQIPKFGFMSRFQENKGLEGITYNKERNEIIICEEKNLTTCCTVNMDTMQPVLQKLDTGGVLDDISGLNWGDQHLMVLSDESRKVLITNKNANEVKMINLAQFDPEKKYMPQPEGIVTVGNLLIITSEKNMFNILLKK